MSFGFFKIAGAVTMVVGALGSNYVVGIEQVSKDPRMCLVREKKDGLVTWYNNCSKPVTYAIYDKELIDQRTEMSLNFKPNVQFGAAAANEKISSMKRDVYNRSFIHECYAPQTPVLENYTFSCK